MAGKMKAEKKQHIQVFTRVRPLSSQELRSQVVVECLNTKEVCVRDKSQTKTFTFDKVFGPDSKQIDVYKAVVNPLISEVLQGYNCTVFAYGQTGTGKTYTMVGDRSPNHTTSWEEDPSCGIIPRTLSHLFDELKIRAEEFTVRVSFLELYNEELCDLLAPSISDDSKNLRLYEDSMKKGSVIVSGLEERAVHNKDDVYAILEAGNLKRQTASTLMNAQSSRSHTIFTITVHIKVTTPEGEDLIKTGKLNLVDLAGSENIGRSGAVDMRAREAGNINQSLLTLGRVITSLVERTPHIPYRESKLTRILQDSLGGRTKTSIIATVSPALCNIDETLSTFDYAHRARNITNKPEINQKTSKRVLLKEYTQEIERLRRDLIATREKHGVYLASDNYNAIMAERENLNKELIAKLNLLKVREEELAKQEEIMKNLNMDLFATQNELENTCKELQETKKICVEREDMFNQLSQQSNELLKAVDAAVADARRLHDRLDLSRKIQERNINSTEKFKNNYCNNLTDMKNKTKEFLTNGVNEVQSQIEMNKQFYSVYLDNHNALKERTIILKNETDKFFQTTIDLFSEQANSAQLFLSEQLEKLKSSIDVQNGVAHKILSDLMEYSEKMSANWTQLHSNALKSKETLEEQRKELRLIEDKSAQITNIILQLPIVLCNKMKEQEEILKRYEEKCEKLEAKEKELKERNDEFGQNLLKMSQEFVERLLTERECQERLKNLRDEKKHEESNVMNDAMKRLQETVQEASEETKEAQEITTRVIKTANDMIDNFDGVILPLINDMSNAEVDWSRKVKVTVHQELEERDKSLKSMTERSISETERAKDLSGSAVENTNQNLIGLHNMYDVIETMTESQVSEVEKVMNENVRRKQNLCSNITEHSEELFSNIHHRVKEIEVFFTEGIQRDEKTGETPQRREFHYPKRIISLASRNRIESDADSVILNKKFEKNLSLDSLMLEVTCNDRLGKKVRVKCNPDDTIGDLKKLIAAQTGTRWDKIVLKKWYIVFKDHIKLQDYEIHDGMNLELYYQ